jgi:type II secretion system protein G
MPTSVTRARAGFTLIEMLVVIIVIGLLAGLVGPRILGRVSEAKTATARTQVELLGLALDNYRLDNGSYPTTEQGLAALQEKPVGPPLRLHQPWSAESLDVRSLDLRARRAGRGRRRRRGRAELEVETPTAARR